MCHIDIQIPKNSHCIHWHPDMNTILSRDRKKETSTMFVSRHCAINLITESRSGRIDCLIRLTKLRKSLMGILFSTLQITSFDVGLGMYLTFSLATVMLTLIGLTNISKTRGLETYVLVIRVLFLGYPFHFSLVKN